MNATRILLTAALAAAGSLSAQITDLSTWTLTQDPAHPQFTSGQSATLLTLSAGNGAIPAATDIGFQSVNGSTASTSTAGFAFSPAQSFSIAIDYSFSSSSAVGNLGFGFGIGEDINGTNSAGVAAIVASGVGSFAGTAGRINDVTQSPTPLSFGVPLVGSLHVSYNAANGTVTSGIGLPGAASTLISGSFNSIANSWTGAQLFPAVFLRSDSTIGSPWTSGTAQMLWSNFRVLSGSASAVPEPATVALFAGAAVLGLAVAARRRRS